MPYIPRSGRPSPNTPTPWRPIHLLVAKDRRKILLTLFQAYTQCHDGLGPRKDRNRGPKLCELSPSTQGCSTGSKASRTPRVSRWHSTSHSLPIGHAYVSGSTSPPPT